MKLVILTGGKGTRLGFNNIPKPMVQVAGKPILEYQIDLAKRYNISDIYFLSGYLADVISDYFGNGSSFGVNIHNIIEDKPLGTSGAVKLLEEVMNERFLVFYGDVVLDFDIDSFIKFDSNNNSIATILVHPNDHPYDSDLVESDQNNIVTEFHSKPHKENSFYPNLVNAAVYILSPEIFQYIEKDKFSDFGKDIFPELLRNKKKIFAYNSPEYINDMGTLDRLKKVEKDIINGKVARKNIENKQKAIFIDRDGVLNFDIDSIVHEDQLELIPNAAQAVKIINKSDYLAVLVTNQPVVAKGFVSDQGLKKIHNKLEYLLGLEGAYLDRIYYCPHHPDKGFTGERTDLKINCECRKPNIGMIKSAERDLNIDLNNSYIIGDSFRDILCGKNAGLTSIGVRTGKGLKDKYVEPDYLFDDLYNAVDFLINEPYYKQYLVIKEKIISNKDRPFVASIGGLSRSGKTILTNYLAKQLLFDGLNVLVISLDNWLVSKENRKDEFTVYERFQLERIDFDFKKFFNDESIHINRYSALDRKTDDIKLIYKKNSYDVVIIDGIVGLSSSIILKNSDIKIFCDINNDLLYLRFFNFYKWKGLSESEIENEFQSRMKDEYTLIKKDREKADIIIEAD